MWTDLQQTSKQRTTTVDSGEPHTDNITSKCTILCGDLRIGRSCSKTVLVDVCSVAAPNKTMRVYAAIDDQSNRTLATPELLDRLGIQGKHAQFNMSSCPDNSTLTGRLASNICVQSIDGEYIFELQDVIKCDSIPSDLHEVATPDVASAHSHLRRIALYLPALEPSNKFELLIGRDIPEIHHVHEQMFGDRGKPFAQKLPLGWVIIGKVRLGKVNAPTEISFVKRMFSTMDEVLHLRYVNITLR